MNNQHTKLSSAHPRVFGPHVKDIRGQVFGRLTVLDYDGIDRRGNARWKCQCSCGSIRYGMTANLVRGITKSCGCLVPDNNRATKTKHGNAAGGYLSPEYKVWQHMLSRCKNPNGPDWTIYGGRGIKVCERWQKSFINFLSDMGPRPSSKYSIDRINSDGNYEPINCRWATIIQQARNRSSNRFIEWRGERRTISEWTEILGFPRNLIIQRIKMGWSIEKTMTTPPKKNPRLVVGQGFEFGDGI